MPPGFCFLLVVLIPDGAIGNQTFRAYDIYQDSWASSVLTTLPNIKGIVECGAACQLNPLFNCSAFAVVDSECQLANGATVVRNINREMKAHLDEKFSSFPCSEPEVTDAASASVKSPIYGLGNYPVEVECIWHINEPSGRKIRMKSDGVFGMEGPGEGLCPKDFIEFYDGNSTTDPVLGRFCGTDQVPFIVSTSNTITIRFFSDNDTTGLGFEIEVKSIEVNEGAMVYVGNESLVYEVSDVFVIHHTYFHTDWNFQIELEILEITAETISCSVGNSSMKIFDSNYIGRANMYNVTPVCDEIGLRKFLSPKQGITIELDLRAEQSLTSQTWRFNLTKVLYALQTCDQTISVSGPGDMTFPNNGAPHYGKNMFCDFSLSAPAGQKITFSFYYFKSNDYINPGDLLTITDSDGREINGQDKYHVFRPPRNGTYLSVGETIAINFVSDAQFTEKGFKIAFNSVTTSTLDTILNCSWLPFVPGEVIACPPGFVMTGFCDSLDVPNCNGSASEAKCCQVDGFSIVDSSCQAKAQNGGDSFGCNEVTDSFSTYLGATCSSLNQTACEDEMGSVNASALNVQCGPATLNGNMVAGFSGEDSTSTFCPWTYGTGRLECGTSGQIVSGRCGSLETESCMENAIAHVHAIKCCTVEMILP